MMCAMSCVVKWWGGALMGWRNIMRDVVRVPWCCGGGRRGEPPHFPYHKNQSHKTHISIYVMR